MRDLVFNFIISFRYQMVARVMQYLI